jgi:hypothetical protein
MSKQTQAEKWFEDELDMFAKHGVKTIICGKSKYKLVKRKKRPKRS